MTDAPKPTLTEAEHDALVQAVGQHCSHTGPVDMSLPHGCRNCDEIVRVDVAGTVALIKAAARREALLEAERAMWGEGAEDDATYERLCAIPRERTPFYVLTIRELRVKDEPCDEEGGR